MIQLIAQSVHDRCLRLRVPQFRDATWAASAKASSLIASIAYVALRDRSDKTCKPAIRKSMGKVLRTSSHFNSAVATLTTKVVVKTDSHRSRIMVTNVYETTSG